MENKSGGAYLGLCDVIFIVLLILKLTGNIDLSWWWITAPLWFGFTCGIIGLIIYCIIVKVLYEK